MPFLSRRRFVTRSATGIGTIGFVTAAAKGAEFQFRVACDLPVDHPTSVNAKKMWAAVNQESGGRIDAQFFPNSELGGDVAMFSQLRLGALHFVFVNPGNLAAIVPVANISYMGFTYKDDDEGIRAMSGPLGLYIRNETGAKGLHVLRSIWSSGMLQIASGARPIRTPDDLHGFKIRVLASRIQSDLFKELGATPTTITLGEIYTALQTRVLDGTAGPLVTIETAHWYEVQKYISLTNHAWTAMWQLANGDVWRRLPPDLQNLIERNNAKFAQIGGKEAKAANVSAASKLMQQGMTMNRVDQAPFRAGVPSYFQFWQNAFGSTPWALLEASLGRRLT
jgi:TRAP-type transport system periplasmic protein